MRAPTSLSGTFSTTKAGNRSLCRAAAAYKVNHEENDSEYEEDMNEESCNVEHNERSDPDENHQNREQQEYKAHKQSSDKRFGWLNSPQTSVS
jgi:hypothetical protein